MSTPEQSDLAEFFTRQWHTYQRVFERNYMFHREFAGKVREVLLEAFPKPYSLLDLGCGDAAFTVSAVQATPIASYIGVDLSVEALKLAGTVMQKSGAQCEFVESDLTEAPNHARRCLPHVDAVLASYSIHHLDVAKKRELFAALSEIISPEGIVLMIDLLRPHGETREQFVERYIAWVESEWADLAPDEIASIASHIRSSDFPETKATFDDIAAAAGLQAGCPYVAPHGTEALFVFRPAEASGS